MKKENLNSMDSDEKSLLVEIISGVMKVTLNRPEKLNSMNASMCDSLITALKTAENTSSVRSVLITGSGRAFCAGQDLGDRDPRNSS